MPTLIPTVPHIIHQMSISVNPVEWVTAISMVPIRQGSAPSLPAARWPLRHIPQKQALQAGEMDRLFVKMFGISAIGVVTLSTLAYFGFYRWLL